MQGLCIESHAIHVLVVDALVHCMTLPAWLHNYILKLESLINFQRNAAKKSRSAGEVVLRQMKENTKVSLRFRNCAWSILCQDDMQIELTMESEH